MSYTELLAEYVYTDFAAKLSLMHTDKNEALVHLLAAVNGSALPQNFKVRIIKKFIRKYKKKLDPKLVENIEAASNFAESC